MHFNVKVKQQIVDQLPLWVNDFNSANQFMLLYDSVATILEVAPQIKIDLNKNIMIKADAKYNAFELTSQSEAWHKPGLYVKLGGHYDDLDKIKVGAEVFYMGERTALDENGNGIPLQEFYDFNLFGNYLVNDNISLFVEGRNLLNKSYQDWYQYPTYGLQARGGLIIKL